MHVHRLGYLKATVNPGGWIKGTRGQNLIGFYLVLKCWPCALILLNFVIYGYRSEFPMILVGNKSDLEQERTVSHSWETSSTKQRVMSRINESVFMISQTASNVNFMVL